LIQNLVEVSGRWYLYTCYYNRVTANNDLSCKSFKDPEHHVHYALSSSKLPFEFSCYELWKEDICTFCCEQWLSSCMLYIFLNSGEYQFHVSTVQWWVYMSIILFFWTVVSACLHTVC